MRLRKKKLDEDEAPVVSPTPELPWQLPVIQCKKKKKCCKKYKKGDRCKKCPKR